MATSIVGKLDWSGSRDEEGHREYKVVHLVQSSLTDGPLTVMNTSGLPAIGSFWNYSGLSSDVDPWAFCRPNMQITPRVSEEPNRFWEVEQTFSTKPLKRCQDTSIDNPLDEPDRISGGFTKYTEEAAKDRFGLPILSSSHEQIRGSGVEKDNNRPTVTIEKNLSVLPLGVFAAMLDTVNSSSLWGLPARCIKLSSVSWSRQLYGTCYFYYTVSYEFDIRYDTIAGIAGGFDRVLIDEGTMVLSKGGDKDNPQDFEKYKDRNGENARAILNGDGEAWDGTGTDGPGNITVYLYNESNFLLLGIPTSL